MIVFKTFLKVLNKCKAPIILYTVFLIFFGGFNIQTSENSMSFVASKPDVLIVNRDNDEEITKNLIDYITNNCNIIEVKDTDDAINDALFYRDVNYIIYIPENYNKDFLDNKKPKIEVKSTGDYQSALAEMMLERYIKVANTYNEANLSVDDKIQKINDTLSKETKIEITSKLDTESIEKATFYYNFTNYCILAGCIYVICLILSSFKNKTINKRTIISSMNYKEYNTKLLISNCLFAVVLWILYVLLSFILVGDIMFTSHGIVYIVNSFIFTICAVTIAFLLGNVIMNKEAINGIVNVIALGSSFLCGAFVPADILPDAVLKIAHVLPSYWFIRTNEMLKNIEEINFETLKPLMINMGIVVIFSITFVVITNIISGKKRKID